MVRLKLDVYFPGGGATAHFNSTMVRLKLVNHVPETVKLVKFQFHNGSIKAFQMIPPHWRQFPNFNSTMVRLKLAVIKNMATETEISIPQWFD